MAKNDTVPDTRTILVILKGGKRRQVSNIPANAKITYGPVTPGNWNCVTAGGIRKELVPKSGRELIPEPFAL